MEVCQVCGKSYKKVTASHLKTHDMTLEDYLKLYKKEEYKERKLTQFLMENYVSQCDKYKILYYKNGKDANCTTIKVTQEEDSKRRFPLGATDIKRHLRGYCGIGIYPLFATSSRLVAFDIDIKKDVKDKSNGLEYCKELLGLIIAKLYQFGITDEYILASFSGNKGYHVDIFLSDFLNKEVIEKFQKIVSFEAFSDASYEANRDVNVEFRGSNNSAYKLPLCYHYKTWNKAYLCNEFGVEIDDLECLNKKNLSISKIYEVVNLNKDSIKDRELVKEFTETVLNTNLLDMHKQENKVRRENVGKLLDTNITEEYISTNVRDSSRNSLLMDVALYLKFVEKLDEEKALLILETWVNNRWDKDLIDAECKSLIKSNIKWVYKRGKFFDNSNKEFYITKEHMKEVLSIDVKHKQKNLSLRKLYFILMLHSNYFANSRSGEFSMSYSTMEKMGAIKNNRSVLKKQLEELQSLGKIVIVSCGVKKDTESAKYKYEKGKVYESNIYKLNKSFATYDSSIKGIKHCNKEYDCNNCMQILSCTLLERRHTTSFITAKEYKILKDSCPYNSNSKSD